MFSKSADPTATLPRPTIGSNSGNRSVLSSDLKIVGEISSSGAVEILGEVEGTVTAHSLTIGAEGRMSGDVSAETVEIKGKLEGRVSSHTFTLRAAAQVKADVNYATLVIESGAQIEGRFVLNKG
jgi:cytoskeletal protein CcmA (bactofilin family)